MVNNIQNIIYEKRKTITKIVGINDAFERRIKLAQDVISVARIGNKFQDALICFKNVHLIILAIGRKKTLKILEYKSMLK